MIRSLDRPGPRRPGRHPRTAARRRPGPRRRGATLAADVAQEYAGLGRPAGRVAVLLLDLLHRTGQAERADALAAMLTD